MKHDRILTPVFLPVTVTQRTEVWQPAVDIYQTPVGWLVKVDLAGVRPDDVTVELRGRIILIRKADAPRPVPGGRLQPLPDGNRV